MNIADFGLVYWDTDLIDYGDRYGRLSVLELGKIENTYRYFAICQCACGSAPLRVRVDKLRSGHTTSCGCAQKESVTRHGLWDHPLYKVWSHMIDRCYKRNSPRYRHYGARGIRVCERWHDLRNFVADMFASYKPGLQIERIDNDGSYEPSNCRWASRGEQARNKMSNIRVSHAGKSITLAEWSRETGINYGTLWERIVVLKWPVDKALTTSALDASKRRHLARTARCGR